MRRRKQRNKSHQQRQAPPERVKVSRVGMDIRREIRYITERARAGEARLVQLGPFVLFSTETHDAWLLDAEDNFALCLLRDGQPQPYRIIDTLHKFAIEWNVTFQIDGACFVVVERSGKVRTILGYPTQQIAAACARSQ